MTSRTCSIVVSFALLSAAVPAWAQSSAAIAEGLFRDGKRLLDKKQYADACPKFEESARMAPSSGVELALGICYEGLGKTASAWAAYEQAVSLARRDNRQDRERAATSKAAALEPKLSRATITVPDDVAPLPGLEVKEDDIVIGAAAWKDSPIDPGTHKLEVAATGKKPWSTTFTIEGGGATKSVPVPELEDKPAPPPPKESEQVVLWEQRTPNNPLRTAAYVAIGAGAVTLVAASILGGVAISDASDVHKTCPNPTCTDSRAVSENDTAGSLADWSTVLFVVSGVCLAAGVVLFFIRPPASTVKRTTATVHPLIGPGSFGIGGSF